MAAVKYFRIYAMAVKPRYGARPAHRGQGLGPMTR